MTQNTMDKTKIRFRDAQPSDFETVLNLWQRTFNKHAEEMDILKDLLLADKNQQVNHLRLMEYQGKTIGCVKTENRLLQFGQAKLLCGDVGYVAIDPSFQSRGLGHLLMEDNSHLLEERGYDLGRLGGLVHFYSRFGWSKFPSYSWRFWLGDVSGGVKKIPFETIVAVKPEDRQKIRPMIKTNDWIQYQQACKQGHQRAFWYLACESPRRQMDFDRQNDFELERWVYEENGRVLACLELFNKAQISDVGWQEGCLREFTQLLKFALERIKASSPAQQYATASLPWDHQLTNTLSDIGLRFELIKSYSGISSNMIKIVNLKRLMNHYGPELTMRIKTLPNVPSTRVTFILEESNQQVTLDLADGRLCDEPTAPSDMTCRMTQTDFLSMLMGTACIDQTPLAASASIDKLIRLNALFPLQVICG